METIKHWRIASTDDIGEEEECTTCGRTGCIISFTLWVNGPRQEKSLCEDCAIRIIPHNIYEHILSLECERHEEHWYGLSFLNDRLTSESRDFYTHLQQLDNVISCYIIIWYDFVLRIKEHIGG
jgi:protein-arginine kinase activator protein McsA